MTLPLAMDLLPAGFRVHLEDTEEVSGYSVFSWRSKSEQSKTH